MSSLSRELVFLILQFLDEEKFKETVHRLEQESGFLFNMKHFEDLVQAGEWDEVEKYLSGFTKVEDNRYSMKIFFEIRKQKYLEALDRHERGKAVELLVKDLKVFASFNEELFKEITQLLTLDNFRQNEQLSKYGDTKSARTIMLSELKKLIEANPLFRDKLTFPPIKASRLRTLINQSLNWQHQLCKNPRPNPDIKTLFTDHTCAPANGARTPPPANSPLVGPIPKAGGFPPGSHSPFQQVVTPTSALAGWMTNANPSLAPLGLVPPPNAAPFLKHPRTPPTAPGMDYQADSEHLMKRMRAGHSEEVSFVGSAHHGNVYSLEDLPRTVVRTLHQGSNVMSLDFHPQQQTILLVGTNIGDIAIWEVGARERIAHKAFKVWDISACSMPLQAALMKDATVSVNRCLWSPDGSILGVAFSKHIVQTYAFASNGELRPQLEIDAHIGGVNDIAFSHPNKSLSIVTCGDDKTIKVWDATTGQRQYTFESHDAPVYSVCPHYKESIQFIFSTAIDGKIKAWLYDCLGSRVDYDAPGLWCTTMAYSADGTRLFSCGTSKEGESHLVEWNETEGSIKRTYSGFRKRSTGVVQFDTTRNHFLAAGDEFQIKFWDMDNKDMLTYTDADGGLPASPRLRFNREGSLLAVTTNDNGIKILANSDGQRLIRMLETRAYENSRSSSQPHNNKASIVSALGSMSNVSAPVPSSLERSDKISPQIPMATLTAMETSRTPDVKPRISDDLDKVKSWKLADIVDPNLLKAIKLPESATTAGKIVRLLYTNSGSAVLALTSNAVHKLWKWQRTERNSSGKSTSSVMPQLWQPANGVHMTNDTPDSSTDDSIACIALSKNDSYVMSASGGKVSLFNMMTFKVMTTFMPPPPAATFLAFHPQDNNIIAIGMEDSTIQIYNVRVDEVKMKLKGHQKKVTGLAFSQSLNVLVSSGADAQICVWSMDGWENRRARFIQPPPGRAGPLVGETRVQFHNDQKQLLVVHESQLAIYDTKLECLRSDELLGLAEEANGDPIYKSPSLDMDVLYRAGETQQGNVTYTPRLISIGLQGSLGSLSSSGQLYDEIPSSGLSDVTTWSGDVSKHMSEPHKKNLFLQRLCEEEQPKHNVPTSHAEKSADEPGTELQDKDLVACLENEVQFWTDFSKVHYHPQSLYEFHGSWITTQEFDNYGIGREFFSGSYHEEEVNERLRFFVEECDHIQGIQFILDDYGGFSSVAADFLEHIADEYPNKPVLLYSARGPDGCKNATSKRASINKVLHDAVSFSRLSSLCKLMVPLGLPSLSTSKVSACLRVDDSKPFHCSAVYAASIHSMSLPFRMDPPGPSTNCVNIAGAMDVGGLVQMLTGQVRQNTVAILDAAIPAPCLKGDSAYGPLMRNLHPLTPETAADGEDPQAVESLVVHGAFSSAGRRASISEVKDSVYSAHHHGLPKPMFLHLSAALCPLPIPLPFPSIFCNIVGQHGELLGNPIQGNLSRGSLDVNSIPMAARLRSSSAILPFIRTRSDNLRRYGMERGAAGTQMLRDWGFGKDEVEDMGEALSRMLMSLNPHVEASSDSD